MGLATYDKSGKFDCVQGKTVSKYRSFTATGGHAIDKLRSREIIQLTEAVEEQLQIYNAREEIERLGTYHMLIHRDITQFSVSISDVVDTFAAKYPRTMRLKLLTDDSDNIIN